MTLLNVLTLISKEDFPPVLLTKKGKAITFELELQTDYLLHICFENSDYDLICDIQNTILIPWFGCEVSAVRPSEQADTLEVWLKDKDYLLKNFKDCLTCEEIEED